MRAPGRDHEPPEESIALPHFYGREYLGPDKVPGRTAM